MIIPFPQSLVSRPGTLTLSASSTITWRGAGADAVAELLAEYLRPATGFPWPVTSGTGGTIQLTTTAAALPDAAGFVDESYKIVVGPSDACLTAPTDTGLARAIQTLRQLFPADIFASNMRSVPWTLPALEIEDAPRFRWRGQHLDVARHFFCLDDVLRFIDLLALHRLNICHLHLTDDQGWRIEIKKYPKLTEVGSYRESTLIGHETARPRRYDNSRYGSFFTQDQVRQIVDFAARRHIIVLPEIDMPGHMVAAVTAYPSLGNFKTQTRVRCHWAISQNVLNVEDSTVTFMKDVLDEVMSLFPGRFIHVGGDEAPRFEWSESQRAQTRMAELGLKNEDQLQSWFISQMNTHITSAGRRLIGWDEILEGGLAHGATVMSWRGEAGGITAAKLGHDVVMAPFERVYFDHYQTYMIDEEPLAFGGMNPTDRVYAYEPIPADLPPELTHHVLGGQGQLWSEYIPTRSHLDYMGFPRICALSEVLWLSAPKKNYTDFLNRLTMHRLRLAALGVNAHPRP